MEHQARLDFVLTLRRRWADTLYPALAAAANGQAGKDINDLPAHRWFAWMERGSQKMLWRAVQAALADDDTELPPPGDDYAGSLTLDAGLEFPDWYTDWDIHVQPGGIWRNEKTAQVYELGAKLVMLGENDDYLFHRLFTEGAIPAREYRRIVDLGCGFGKSTWPFARVFPDAEVIGIDLAGPCLELGHRKCAALGLPVHFRQADCRDTGLETRSADLVTSTMLLHELPPDALEATIHEGARLLAPGGHFAMLDFRYTGQPLRDHVMTGHGARNNEPFMPPAMAADTIAMCEAAGLEGAQWRAFDERGGGVLDDLVWPDRAEWHFPWAVLEAEKPPLET